MKLKLHTESNINNTNIKKMHGCLAAKTIIFITAPWCSHCISFSPEKKKLIEIVDNINIIDINDVALNELKIRNHALWKQIIPDDHRIYFPMILLITNDSTLKKKTKKIYNGSRTSREIREYIKKTT